MSQDHSTGEEGAVDPKAEAREQLGEKLGEVKRSIQELGSLLASLAREKVDEMRKPSPGSAAVEAVDGCCTAESIGRKVEDCIRSQPLLSVGVAAAAGALLGLLCCRRW